MLNYETHLFPKLLFHGWRYSDMLVIMVIWQWCVVFSRAVSPNWGFLTSHTLVPWWRHQMETFSALLALSAGNSLWSPVNSHHKGQWRGALIFSLIYAWTNGRANNRYAGDLRHHCAHYVVTVMSWKRSCMHKLSSPGAAYILIANRSSLCL